MKKMILISLIILSGLFSCKKIKYEVDPDVIGVPISSYWISDKDITTQYNQVFQKDIFSISEGNFLIFKYVWSKDNSRYLDDEQAISLVFKINNDIQQFDYTNTEISETSCYYQANGAFYFNQYVVKTGNIKGSKQSDGNWKIFASVSVTPGNSGQEPIKLEFNRLFQK